ncbi:Mu transposase C-terminal domain-containing protein [Hydrogenophaga taeniospiralis]|uniref:Mu transposase C-terminal domain-containing protein n=1 Tax=Hydrogenophaga taeniospiralis TaxID=65656 RepID=UPI001CFC0DF3|nr:Mu transposase C-terminal domain-containing protein [Hydrogenophaga taeniospiralis]UCU92672.1 Mu transposase C-terminal domain-containing protein [Hydrogenophaga taeniospiralis]
MTTWLTARELAGLPGMPTAEFRTREKLQRLGIPGRPRLGREGGGGTEYDCSALPEETRAAIAARQITQAGSTVLALVESVPVRSFVPPTLPDPRPGQLAPVPSPSRRPPSQADKSVADARVHLVNLVQTLVPLHGLKRSCVLLAAQLVTGEAGAEVLAIARTANQRARGDSVSARTLERWIGAHRESGWWGLLPVAVEVAITPERMEQDVAAVLGLYHSRNPEFRKLTQAAKKVTRAMGREFDTWEALYGRARRALDKLGQSHEANVALIKSRHSGSERDVKLPFKRRDASMLAPLDVWVMDGHSFKAKVRHPDHGAPFAPELTLALDWSCRKIMGWSVSLSENVFAVGDALRHGVGQYGKPALLYTDNGGGETGKPMDCPIDGFAARLGIDHRTGIPGKPQGRGVIERSWQTHAINCARQFGSYQGSDVDGGEFRKVAAELAKEQRAVKRAQETGTVVRLSTKCPTWAQFVEAVERMVAEYNGTHRHRMLPKRADGKHMTPDEAWAAKFDASLQHLPTQGELRELFMPAVLRTARRGEVQFFNQTYSAPELMRRDVEGCEVSVRYDIHDPSWVRIYTLDGQFVCDARFAANRIDAMPKAVVQMAREKRVAATVKLRQQQIETALRELDSPVQADTVFLPDPFAPVVLGSTLEAQTSSSLPDSSMGEPAQADSGRPFFDTPGARYEWLMRHRDEWTGVDQEWIAQYVESDSYEQLREYYEGRGLGWGTAAEEQPGFKSAL